MTRHRDRGQVLVIVAVGLVVFLGMAALVVDIGMVYATQRHERSLTDASSLAGAQELQQVGTRTVTPADRVDARTQAMTTLMDDLAPGWSALPACGFGADFTDCAIPGTNYLVSMRTPATLCVTCDEERSLLVSLERRDVPTFFAGLFGQNGWDIRQTSVSGISYEAKYAVITLRPPKPAHASQNDPDIFVNGAGSSLIVENGDIGSNTNLVNSGTVTLDPGFKVHHYDKPQAWVSPPDGHPIPTWILDPNYTIPTEAGADQFTSLSAGAMTDPECLAQIATVPGNYVLGGQIVQDLDPAVDDVTCYRPGAYDDELEGGNGEFILLTPGVYFLNAGADLNQNYLIGGWEENAPGVAVVLNRCNPGGGGGCALRGEASLSILLNAGTLFNNTNPAPPAPQIYFAAAPAETVGGTQVITSGIEPDEIGLTLMVRKDPTCMPGAFEPSASCSPPSNNTLTLAGGGNVFLAGVQYAPTDNVVFTGGSSGNGYVGQIISWTVTYSGGTDVRQVYPGQEGNGILRIDEACSGSGSNGMSNAACSPQP